MQRQYFNSLAHILFHLISSSSLTLSFNPNWFSLTFVNCLYIVDTIYKYTNCRKTMGVVRWANNSPRKIYKLQNAYTMPRMNQMGIHGTGPSNQNGHGDSEHGIYGHSQYQGHQIYFQVKCTNTN